MSEDELPQDDPLADVEGADSTEESSDDDMSAWAEALEEQDASESTEKTAADDLVPAEFESLNDSGAQSEGDDVNLDVILDVPVDLSMEIGRTRINIRNLLQLNQGSVVELDRLAGEPMDVLINGMLIAHGEVVVVNDKFGVRLTDVISPSERVKKLR